jgi:hypothetical protein
MTVRLIGHEESFEVRYSDGRPSKYFYFDEHARTLGVSFSEPIVGLSTREERVRRAIAGAWFVPLSASQCSR